MIEFELQDMTCGHCAGMVNRTVKLVDPEAKIEVDVASKKVKIESSEDRATFVEALTEAGYPPAA
ncbi:heavy-metal-associated domain-containing protein [Polaromonas sp.]|uniref:heavy-metal-associated domain-containing protein n=1 Tax=Polaromonas sp. TaxID=1869339 RepID=UPI003BAC8074